MFLTMCMVLFLFGGLFHGLLTVTEVLASACNPHFTYLPYFNQYICKMNVYTLVTLIK